MSYHVWRRSDGYVGSSKGSTARLTQKKNEFDILLTTDDWSEAYDKIVEQRDQRHHNLVKSWAIENDCGSTLMRLYVE